MTLEPITLNEDKSQEIYAPADCQLLLSMYDEFYPKIGFNPPWIGYFIIRENQVVGSCSFVGQPTDGNVEISYWTFKAFEGQGVATFACSELIKIVRLASSDVSVTAKTEPEPNASTRILENNGFTFTEVVQDNEIGDAWLWTLKP